MDQGPYNKLIIFDLDGVLMDSRELHYQALNKALGQWGISREEHLSTYDGLPTRQKLEMLSVKKGLPREMHDDLARKKQALTIDLLKDVKVRSDIIGLFGMMKERDYKIAVASNSVRNTLKHSLINLQLMKFVDYYVSNEDVQKNKPYPEMYWKCMQALNAIPATTIIVEDSHIGRQGAIDSGATLLPVENPDDLTWEKLRTAVNEMNNKKGITNVPWRDSNLNVVIPMAGAGSRFAQAGYTFPKPLIDVHGKPMLQVVLENLNIDARYIFIVQREHFEKYNLKYMFNLLVPRWDCILMDGVSDGAARTVLEARQIIDTSNHLLIVNSDQFIEWNSNEVMYSFAADDIDGGILTFESTHPKYSFVKTDENGFVSEVAEKKVISNQATVGMYYWNRGSDYVKYAQQMIGANKRVNNEFYVAPVYQEAIADGKKIKVKNIKRFWSLGTPEDLNYFLAEHK